MNITVTRNDQANRFEGRDENGQVVGFADYRPQGTVLDVVHTEVDPKFGGQGVGGQLVDQMMEQVREAGQQVRPSCPFVAKWFDKHPDQASLRA